MLSIQRLGMIGLFGIPCMLLIGCGEKEDVAAGPVVRPAKVFKVDAKASQPTPRTYPGRVKAAKEAELAFQVGGPLVELPVKESDEVKKNQLIARVDARDYETAIKNAKSQVSEARAQEKAMRAGARPEDLRILEAKLTAAIFYHLS